MRKSTLIAVVLPIAVLGVWLAKLEWLKGSETQVRLAVRGFDPRDLLAGHFLRYTVDYGPAGECPKEPLDEEACVCLMEKPKTNVHEANWAGPCSARPVECSVFVKGHCNHGRFEANIERFYFPETFQSTLRVVPEKSAIVVALGPSGEAMVTGFEVDGVNLLDYARAQQTAQ